MKTSNLALLLLAALCLTILASATPSRADDTPLRQALVALARLVEDPTPCGSDRKCQGVYRKAFTALEAAEGDLGQGDVESGLSGAAKGLSGLEKSGHAVGELSLRISALVDAADVAMSSRRDATQQVIDGLCSSARCAATEKLAKPDDQLRIAREARAAGQWSLALRSYGAALRGYASVEEGADKLRAECNPPACSSNEFVHFTPGSGTQVLELAAPDVGTSTCYGVSSDFDVEGRLCVLHTDRGTSYWGTLESSNIDVTLSGTASVDACIDSANWVRAKSIQLSLMLAADGMGRRKMSASVSATPPTVSFFGGLLPTSPSALQLRAGDRMEERDVILESSGLTQVCDSVVHRVVAIENVRVMAGTFRAARIQTSASCRVVMDGDEIDLSIEATTWVASEVGQVLVQADIDGNYVRYELESMGIPEGC